MGSKLLKRASLILVILTAVTAPAASGMFQELIEWPPTVDTEPRKVNYNHIGQTYGVLSGAFWSANLIYLSNSPTDPWLYPSPDAAHWSGLLSGAGTVLLGALNMDTRIPEVPTAITPSYGCALGPGSCAKTEYTNHARTALSAINLAMGTYTVGRAAYHLLFGSQWEKQSGNTTGSDVEVGAVRTGYIVGKRSAPALKWTVRF